MDLMINGGRYSPLQQKVSIPAQNLLNQPTFSQPYSHCAANKDVFFGTSGLTKTEKNNLKQVIGLGFDSSQQVLAYLDEDSEIEDGDSCKRFEKYGFSRLPLVTEVNTPLQDHRRQAAEQAYKASGDWYKIQLTPIEEEGLTAQQFRDKLRAKRRKAAEQAHGEACTDGDGPAHRQKKVKASSNASQTALEAEENRRWGLPMRTSPAQRVLEVNQRLGLPAHATLD